MKRTCKSFGKKLWCWFIVFTAVIFALLWLLQIVFLQKFYDGMAIWNVKRVASEIAGQQGSNNLEEVISDFAASDSLLIFLTDWEGNVIFSADEHNSVYKEGQTWHDGRNISGENPYRDPDETMSWQIGSFRNLPSGYGDFLQRLSASENHHAGSRCVGYKTETGDAYIYGMELPTGQAGDESRVLYISMQLGAVGAATGILRIQLIWVTLLSLMIGFVISYFLSRQFAGPVQAISLQAKRMAGVSHQAADEAGEDDKDDENNRNDGNDRKHRNHGNDGNGDSSSGRYVKYKKGFCLELDELSETLEGTEQELVRLENARRELLANVSHDLRTPLTMIKGYAEIVRDLSWNDDVRREEDLAVIIRESDRLTALVNDILEYSAVQSTSAEYGFSQIDFSRTVENVVEEYSALCEQKKCRMEVSVTSDQWVCGDENRLKRVLYNLIDNALSHSESSRGIRISLMECGKSGEKVRVEVQDFGKGIPKEQLSRIWDRYFTSKQRRKNGMNSGLGLAIVKEVLTAHQADFGVESQPGQGCLFWFELKKSRKETGGLM